MLKIYNVMLWLFKQSLGYSYSELKDRRVRPKFQGISDGLKFFKPSMFNHGIHQTDYKFSNSISLFTIKRVLSLH